MGVTVETIERDQQQLPLINRRSEGGLEMADYNAQSSNNVIYVRCLLMKIVILFVYTAGIIKRRR